MKLKKRLTFLIQTVIAGLALAFILVFFYPQIISTPQISNIPNTSSKAVFSYADAVARAAPAVVNIYTEKRITRSPSVDDPFFRFFFGEEVPQQQQTETSLGSGVIVDEEGYILTNNHVIEEADEIHIALRDGRVTKATVVGTDPESDLAVLKIRLKSLPTISLGMSESARVGDVVLAIGNPFGVGQTVTMGIISATGRMNLGINTFENFIQTDAAINPGNSGGALINPNGELIGINTAIFSKSGGSQGIGFAIPIQLAHGVMRQIIKQGHVSRGWLGIEIQEMSRELADALKLPNLEGIIIAGVLRNGPADKAKLNPGDVITHINGVAVYTVSQTLNLIAQTRPGEAISLKIYRGGKTMTLKAIVAERPRQEQ